MNWNPKGEFEEKYVALIRLTLKVLFCWLDFLLSLERDYRPEGKRKDTEMLPDVEMWLSCCMIYEGLLFPINASQNSWENLHFHHCVSSFSFLYGNRCIKILHWQSPQRRAQSQVYYTKWDKRDSYAQVTHELVGLERQLKNSIKTGKVLVRTQVRCKVKKNSEQNKTLWHHHIDTADSVS